MAEKPPNPAFAWLKFCLLIWFLLALPCLATIFVGLLFDDMLLSENNKSRFAIFLLAAFGVSGLGLGAVAILWLVKLINRRR